LWMIDYKTKNYLGIYEWAGEKNALAYVEWLSHLLRNLSTKDSVWYELYPNEEIKTYLEGYRTNDPATLE